MQPFLREEFGNPSSRHEYGRRARDAVEKARAQVAQAVGAKTEEVVFTASGTESNNTFIKGVAVMSTRGVIATGATEHPCVLCAARATARGGIVHAPIAVDSEGRIDRDDLRDILSGGDCALVSVMLANNETGTVQEIRELAEMARAAGALFHTDAAQALGKIPLDFAALGADAMTISGHKAYGPKGAAALIARRDADWAPLLDGGGHEEGRRSGTENTAAIAGFGAAAENCGGARGRRFRKNDNPARPCRGAPDRGRRGDFRRRRAAAAKHLLLRLSRHRRRVAGGDAGPVRICPGVGGGVLQHERRPQPCADGDGI